jgi:hypothetical protein
VQCGNKLDLIDALLPYCTIDQVQCGLLVPGVCDTRCTGVGSVSPPICYPPARDANGQMSLTSGGTTNVQCLSIASAQSAFEARAHSQTAYFVSIVFTQMSGVLICKTRWLSIVTQGLNNEGQLPFSLSLLTFLCFLTRLFSSFLSALSIEFVVVIRCCSYESSTVC